MAEDWDLYAVVRGCNSTPETPPATTNTTSSEDPLSSLATLTFKEENYPFSFSNLVQPRTHGLQELQRLFIPFNPTTSTTTTTTTSGSGSGGSGFGINPNSPFSDSAGSIEQEQQKHQQNQLKVGHKQELQVPQSSSATTLPNTQVSTPRSRKRKIQQKRMVCHVTAENLSADLWAWRKYGQKPIKGSPYPRNYYRCSSSKGCAARKQVERSISEPEMFIVTYTGDHLHPPPTHRNSLAGSTRNKISTTHIPQTEGSGSPRNPANPTMALTSDSLDVEDAAEETVSTNEYPSPDPDLEIQVASDDDILIPNIASMAEDSFMGLHQLGGGGGSVNSSGGSSPASQPGFAPAFNNDNLSDNTRPNPG